MPREVHVRSHPRREYRRRDGTHVDGTYVSEYDREIARLKQEKELTAARTDISKLKSEDEKKKAEAREKEVDVKIKRLETLKRLEDIKKARSRDWGKTLGTLQTLSQFLTSFDDKRLEKEQKEAEILAKRSGTEKDKASVDKIKQERLKIRDERARLRKGIYSKTEEADIQYKLSSSILALDKVGVPLSDYEKRMAEKIRKESREQLEVSSREEMKE